MTSSTLLGMFQHIDLRKKVREISCFPEDWTGSQQAVFVVIALIGLALTVAYALFTDRFPSFDERGLDNPIYTYLKTGRMTYPAYGYFNGMFVHPPTHYFVSAELMKLGLPLFPATALPLVILTALSTALIATGKFSFPVSVALVLGHFSTVFVWGDLVTVRPDVHLSVAWFTGLVALQAAKNCGWSSWRLFVGAAISTYAGTLHYWGTPSFLAVAVYGIWFLCSVPRAGWLRGLEVMAAGCFLVGGLYVVDFVIPQWDNIRLFTSQVQSQGSGWQDAFNRHREAYASLDSRLFYQASSAPSPLLAPRWLVDVILTPVFDWRIPVIFIAVPILAIWRETRPLAIAGAIVPLFVLFYAQGKLTGYTGYYLPEVILYLVMFLTVMMKLVALAAGRFTRQAFSGGVASIGAVLTAVLCFAAVPVTMGHNWQFGKFDNDAFEINRAAAFDIVGPGAKVAITSIPTWYIAGGTRMWQAANELSYANPESEVNAALGNAPDRQYPNIRELLRPFTAVVSDTEAWWLNWSKGAPLNDWYQTGLLQMKGFIINLRAGYPIMVELFYAVSDSETGLNVKGYLLEGERVLRFSESNATIDKDEQGEEVWFTVLACPSRPAISDPRAKLFYPFVLRTEPDPSQPHLTMIATTPNDFAGVVTTVGKGCVIRDLVFGRLGDVSREMLKANLRENDQLIQIFTSRNAALSAEDVSK